MATTALQRQRWKEKRRLAGWRDLMAAYYRKIRKSQRTLIVADRFLETLKNHPCLIQIQDAIRRAN